MTQKEIIHCNDSSAHIKFWSQHPPTTLIACLATPHPTTLMDIACACAAATSLSAHSFTYPPICAVSVSNAPTPAITTFIAGATTTSLASTYPPIGIFLSSTPTTTPSEYFSPTPPISFTDSPVLDSSIAAAPITAVPIFANRGTMNGPKYANSQKMTRKA